MILLSLLALTLLAAAVWGVAVYGTPVDTEKRRVVTHGPQRLWRWYRSWVVRLGMWPIGWPHLIDLGLGATHTPHGTTGQRIWTEGKATVVRFDSKARYPQPVLVVHSLVTKPWILDLTKTRSLVRMLCDAGFDVFLLDFGDPDERQAGHGLDEYADVLRRAERIVLATTRQRQLHQITYCTSATLALHAYERDRAPHVASMALIAPAVDFSVPGGFHRVMSHRLLRPSFLLDHHGGVPAAVVREAFHGLRPQAIAALRLRFARRRDAEYREFYAGMARWAWTHRWLPGALFFDIVDLYRTNRLMTSGVLESIDVPVLVAVAARDHIVPSSASLALLSQCAHAQVVEVRSGHVSMVVGTAARIAFWPALATFLHAQQDEPVTRRPPRG